VIWFRALLGLLTLLAIDRETAMISAFASLAGAGVFVSIGAWILFFRDRRSPPRP
jgi:hypothetical protein